MIVVTLGQGDSTCVQQEEARDPMMHRKTPSFLHNKDLSSVKCE